MRRHALDIALLCICTTLLSFLVLVIVASPPERKAAKSSRIEIVDKDLDAGWTVYRDTKTGLEYMKVRDGGISILLNPKNPKELSDMLQEGE